MTVAKITLPRQARVIFNNLHEDRPNLSADLLVIALPGARRIDVSWYPENDPNGAYVVTVFTSSWENREIEIEEKDVNVVIGVVQNISEAFGNTKKQGWSDEPYQPTISYESGSKVAQQILILT